MSKFEVHSIATAPDESKEMMEKVHDKFGMVPNMIGVLAESPVAIEAYVTLTGMLGRSGFDPAEMQLIFLTISRENGCEYCVAAHTGGAKRSSLPDDVIQSLRENRSISDVKLNALAKFCTALCQKRGWVGDDEIQEFLEAGYERRQVLDLLVAIAAKTISNWANHMARTPSDAAFQSFDWKKVA